MGLSSKDWTRYEETKQEFIQVIAKNMNLYGITPSIGRLFGVLYFSDDPMTLDEMRDALAMSKTSMSTGVRTLLDMKMVEPVFKPGVRKDLYRSEDDWYKSFTSLFGIRWRKGTETNIEQMEAAKKKLLEIYENTEDDNLKERIQEDMKRLDYAKQYYDWLMRLIKVIESGEIFEYVPKHVDHEEKKE